VTYTRLCIPQSHATCQPIVAHYRPANARRQYTTNHVTAGRRYTTTVEILTRAWSQGSI